LESSIQDWAVKIAAWYVRISPFASVTVIRLPAVRFRRVTAGFGVPSCSFASEVPYGQCTIFCGSRSQSRSGSWRLPPTMPRWWSSASV
jgi:hypothetical protein